MVHTQEVLICAFVCVCVLFFFYFFLIFERETFFWVLDIESRGFSLCIGCLENRENLLIWVSLVQLY